MGRQEDPHRAPRRSGPGNPRKMAEVQDGGTIEVWGDGTANRSYTYVSDMVAGIYQLMQSDIEKPAYTGAPQRVSVNELVVTVAEVSGKGDHDQAH